MSPVGPKVSTRLALAFGSICVLLLITIALSLSGLNNLRSKVTNITQDNWPSASAAFSASIHSGDNEISFRNLILTDDRVDQATQMDTIKKSQKGIAENLEIMAHLLNSDAERVKSAKNHGGATDLLKNAAAVLQVD